MTEKTNIPQIRFKGFNDVWEQCKVTDISKVSIGLVTTMTKHYTTSGYLLIRNSDIKDNYFDFNENPIFLEKSFAESNSSRMHQVGDVITVHTGDVGTSAVISKKEEKSIGFATIITRPKADLINSNYLSCFLNTEKHKKWAVGISTGDGRTNYNLGDYIKLIVPVPKIEEQIKISKLINNLNNLITLHQRKHEKYTNIKKALLEKMFPQNGEKIPQIRFKGFTEAWEQCKYEELGINYSGGSLSYDDLKDDGKNKCVLYGELYTRYDYIIKNVINRTNKQGLTIYKNDILFPQSTTVDAYSLISPACFNDEIAETSGVFVIRPYDFVNGNFIAYYTKGNSHQRLKLSKKAQGLTIVHLYYQSIKDETIHVPNIDEQNKIACLFIQLDNLITLHQRECEKLKNIKKSLLEKMFV